MLLTNIVVNVNVGNMNSVEVVIPTVEDINAQTKKKGVIKIKYNIGDRFIVRGNVIYEVTGYDDPSFVELMPQDIMEATIEESAPITIHEDMITTLPMYPDNYLGEMSSIGSSEKPAMSLWINPDPGRIGNPYFNVYDTESPKKGTSHVCRLHFFDSGMEYHQDGYLDWILTNKDIKKIKTFLMEDNFDIPDYSNWDMCKFLWNVEYHLFPRRLRYDYFAGKFDEQFKDHPSYVPSTTPIPDTWEYNPPKGKNKRRNLS